MRKLRILMLAICTVISVSESFAQIFEIKTGVNLSTMFSKDRFGNYSKDYTLTSRFLIGVTTEIPLTELFSIESGLLFSSKGYKLDKYFAMWEDSEPIRLYQKAVLNYIDIPLSFKASTLFRKLLIYGNVGPYVGIGLSGKIIADESSGDIIKRNEYRHKMGTDGTWKRFDYGLQAGAGVEINRIVFGLNYSYGLANISQNRDYENKNRIIGLTLGYRFKAS